ncbi:MAG TPA: UDP-N-acetylglucosamine 2-epimerase [Bryobacteraceae bacterium]|nr:UDP-N-acetylglucosamine 2-epimerase [Bryobacteraceae bacterium]
MMRKIAVVTSSRADYSHLYWVLREIEAHPELELHLIAMGPQLSPTFGMPVSEVEQDGFRIAARIECLLDSNTDVAMAKTIGIATLSLADYLATLRPDLLLLIADRYEMLAPASVALALRIPVAHIEGGEITEGAIDDAVRNALTKLSHLHFTSTEAARQRVISMGEAEWRVHRAGAPSLDHLRRTKLKSRAEIERETGLSLRVPFLLATYHPVTIAGDTTREADAVFRALAKLPEPIIFCYPNADAGSRDLIERLRAFTKRHKRAHLLVNLNPVLYWSLLREAFIIAGNSSSGVMEAASFGVPAVDIGIRQRGRERSKNVLTVDADEAQILAAIAKARDPDFRRSLAGMANPYGDGDAARRIVKVLASVPLGEELLRKTA